MKNFIKGLAVVSAIVFVFTWGIIGIKIFDNNYAITVEAYIGLVSIVIFLISVIYLRSQNRCPNCGRIKQSFGEFCPYCGKRIN